MYQILWRNLCPPGYTQEQVYREILCRALPGVEKIVRDNRSARSRLFNGAHNRTTCLRAIHYLLDGCPLRGQTGFVCLRALEDVWAGVLEKLTPEERERFAGHLRVLLGQEPVPAAYQLNPYPKRGEQFWIYEETFSFEALDIPAALLDRPLAEQLAALSLIALTWLLWAEPTPEGKPEQRELVLRLARLLFPDTQIRDREQVMGTLEEVRDEDEERAAGLLEQARLLQGRLNPDYRQAGALCVKLLETCRFATDYTLGRALYLLGCCCEPAVGGCVLPRQYETVEEIFSEALRYGCDQAKEHLGRTDLPGLSGPDGETGVCVVNVENEAAAAVKKTLPAGWSFRSAPDPIRLLDPDLRQRFLFLGEDPEEELWAGLEFLQALGDRCAAGLVLKQRTEVFLRCRSEQAAPLVNTVLEELKPVLKGQRKQLRVFLLDEAKRAAQALYAGHPLFAPLAFERGQRANGRLQSVNVVFLLGQVTDRSLWLLREAFWTALTTREGCRIRLTVLSPEATRLADELTGLCPGLASFTRAGGSLLETGAPVCIQGVDFPEIDCLDVNLSGRRLAKQLEQLENTADYTWYVVDDGPRSLELAVGVREWEIRQAVRENRVARYGQSRSVIALYCRTAREADMARKLLIPREERGDQWFNNYALIPFGDRETLFDWAHLDGGVVEDMARCVHLRYCGQEPRPDRDYPDLLGYEESLYDRESSLAAAMSLPGRLFALGIAPRVWDLRDRTTFWTREARERLAAEAETLLRSDDPEMLRRAEVYEHARWCAYLLSRGWLPASAQEAVSFLKSGTPRHSLPIARLHPCLCSMEELESLQRALEFEYGYPGSIEHIRDRRFERYQVRDGKADLFTALDRQQMLATPDVLRTVWLD